MSRRTASTRSAAATTTSHPITTPSHTTRTSTTTISAPPPPQPQPPPKPTPKLGSRTLIIDPGAHTLKAGFLTSYPSPSQDCHIIPHCLAKSPRSNTTYIASDLLSLCPDNSELSFRRPLQNGYIVNWPAETCIFDHEFFSSDNPNAALHCDASDTNLIISEAPNSPAALQRNIDEVVFEEWGFASAFRTTAPVLNAWTPISRLFGDDESLQKAMVSGDIIRPGECVMLVDCGYSHTTVTPLLRGSPINSACRRIPLAGKHISNYLAELISLRHFSLIDEPFIVDQLKQDTCFVSSDFSADLEACWKGTIGSIAETAIQRKRREGIVVDYVLPDYETLHRGFMRPRHFPSSSSSDKAAKSTTTMGKEDVIPLGNERFTPPDLLFTPSLISHPTASLPQTLLHSLSSLPTPLQAPFLANIVLTGGTSQLPGFRDRVEKEVRALVDGDAEVRVAVAEEPVKGAWWGGARMCLREGGVGGLVVSREEYLENGAAWVGRKFAGTRA